MRTLAGLAASYTHRAQGRPSLAYHKRLLLRHPLAGYQRPSVAEIQREREREREIKWKVKNLHFPPVLQYLAQPLWMMNTTVHCWQKKSLFPPMKGEDRLRGYRFSIFLNKIYKASP